MHLGNPSDYGIIGAPKIFEMSFTRRKETVVARVYAWFDIPDDDDYETTMTPDVRGYYVDGLPIEDFYTVCRKLDIEDERIITF